MRTGSQKSAEHECTIKPPNNNREIPKMNRRSYTDTYHDAIYNLLMTIHDETDTALIDKHFRAANNVDEYNMQAYWDAVHVYSIHQDYIYDDLWSNVEADVIPTFNAECTRLLHTILSNKFKSQIDILASQ